MTPAKHNSFESPTIAEALCEIHFSSSNTEFWKQDWPEIIRKRAQGRFPKLDKREIKQFHAEFGPEGIKVAEPGMTTPRAVFSNDLTGTLMQVSPGIITVNELAPYRGWENFQTDIKLAWEIMVEVAQIQSISRVGLRYINRFPRTHTRESVGEWLAKSPFIPEHLLGMTSRFVSRIESGFNGSGRLIVTLAEAMENKDRPIIFDIDTIAEKDLNSSWPTLESVIDGLHETVWSVFSGAIGPKLRKHLDAEAK